MKYLKFFESSDLEDYGITAEEVEYLFTDLTDTGDYSINVYFKKKLKQMNGYKIGTINRFNLVTIPYIEVRLKTNIVKRLNIRLPGSDQNYEFLVRGELNKLLHSDIFKETIEISNERLKEYGLYISQNNYDKIDGKTANLEIDYDFIKILIFKI